MSRLRHIMVIASGVLLAPALGGNALHAQGQSLELRVDFFSLQTSDGNTRIDLEFPGALAMAFYMNQQFALEPQARISHFSNDNDDDTLFALGMFFPFYFNRDTGHTGFFLSPGVLLSKLSGADSNLDFGLDAGWKWKLRDRISSRFALTLRDGDSTDEAIYGATFGLGLFWR